MTYELQRRVLYFTDLFDNLCDTDSRLVKEYYVSGIPADLKEDWMYILEVLDGRHPFGYKYYTTHEINNEQNFMTIKDVLFYLLAPMRMNDLSQTTIDHYVSRTQDMAEFLEPIVNRTLRLGIGKSLLPKTNKSPMLAKKFDDVIIPHDFDGYYVTEKLDGNRCIAEYVDGKWEFTSRNGKVMKVDFDMSELDTDYVYDGEVLSRSQTESSMERTKAVWDGKTNHYIKDSGFNNTSGIINSKFLNKDLVYNIFDIIIDEPYYVRRSILEEQKKNISVLSPTVRILPFLYSTHSTEELMNFVNENLERVTDMNGEGLMINLGSARYENKRTSSLIKVKKTYTMDMKITGYEYGSGKYECAIGSIHCEALQNGCKIECDVGSGLSDEQRFHWALNPEKIIGKIVEVSYFSLSQDKSVLGSKNYSLRFPRLKRVRDDKEETSVD